MQRMVSTYSRVHNKRYWDEVDPFIRSKANSGVILEIGCGPGLLLKDLDDRYGVSKMYGIDLSEVMLEKAKEVLEEKISQNKVELINKNLQEDPELQSNTDLVFSSRVLRSFENQEILMKSLYQSLNPGGRVVLLDWVRAPITVYDTWFKENSNEFVELTPGNVISYHRIFSRYSLDDWAFIFKSFEFDIIHSFALDSVHCCIIAEKPVT